jgi:CheY-like chemotaxis protein
MHSMTEPSAQSYAPAASRYDHRELYGTDAFRVDTVCALIVLAVRDGGTEIVVANAAHRHLFEAALSEAGVDIDWAQRAGRYLAFDAVGLLTRFMIDGRPDAALFRETIGSVLRDASHSGRQIGVYSEMGAVLSDDGDENAALALEHLWNCLARLHQFQLLRAYPDLGPRTAAMSSELVRSRNRDDAAATGRTYQTKLGDKAIRVVPAWARQLRRQRSSAPSAATTAGRIDRQRSHDPPAARAPAAPIRVLVVDDSSMIRLVLRHSLGASDHFEVIGEAVDGRDGIDQAASKQPDIILLDCKMPVMDGMEALAHLASCSPRSLIIMLSANVADSTGPRALAAGAHSYIEKNQQFDALLSQITAAWESWAIRADLPGRPNP